LGTQALRKELGGDLPCPSVDGELLEKFLKLFDEQFARKL
jgi:hypothetical protein